jgi:hypothetical protein
MLDPRRKRQLLIFLGSVVSGVVIPVVAFVALSLASGDDDGLPAAAIIFVVAPFLGTFGWSFVLERRGCERDLANRVAWQAFWVLIAWEAVPIVFVGIMFFLVFIRMVSERNPTVVGILLISTLVVLALWFTWVRSRRILDLLWPLPGMPERGAESPYTQLNL